MRETPTDADDEQPFKQALAALTARYRSAVDLLDQAKLLRQHAERLDAQAAVDEHERPFEDFVASNPYEAMEPFDEATKPADARCEPSPDEWMESSEDE